MSLKHIVVLYRKSSLWWLTLQIYHREPVFLFCFFSFPVLSFCCELLFSSL